MTRSDPVVLAEYKSAGVDRSSVRTGGLQTRYVSCDYWQLSGWDGTWCGLCLADELQPADVNTGTSSWRCWQVCVSETQLVISGTCGFNFDTLPQIQ